MVDEQLKKNEAAKPEDADVAKLRAVFPDCFTKNGAVDFEKLQAKFDGKVKIENEGYRLDFLGKSYARLLTALETTTVVKPDFEHNLKSENAKSRNVYLTADNLDALKQLVKSYAGEVKMIYIDPPYNTGSDGFVYNDKFNFTERELCDKLGVDEQQAKRILGFTKRNASSHSAWLTFMYPRLMLARELLAKDGVIAIAIDDNEYANLRLLCDDVFGEENFISSIVWAAGRKNDSTYISNSHEYMLFYFRDKDYVIDKKIEWKTRKDGLDEIYSTYNALLKEFKDDYETVQAKLRDWYDGLDDSAPSKRHSHYRCVDKNGIYFPSDISWPGGGGPKFEFLHPVTHKPCKVPERGWVYSSAERMQELVDQGLIHFGPDEKTVPCNKTYLKDNEDEVPYSVFYKDGRAATKRLKALLAEGVFQNPKDEEILVHILEYATWRDSLIVDFFSGSGSTAHAVMLENLSMPNSCRRFIVVQIADNLDDAYSNGSADEKKRLKKAIDFLDSVKRPHTLDQIGIERIIRAAKKIRTENPEKAAALDLGFKHYTLVEPSQETLDKVETFDKATSLVGDEGMLKEFGLETVLATWMVRDGYGFGAEPEVVTFGGYAAYWHEKHLYFVKDGLNEQGVKDLMDRYETDPKFSPVNVVIFGYGVSMTMRENLKTNLAKLVDSEKDLKVNIEVRY